MYDITNKLSFEEIENYKVKILMLEKIMNLYQC